MPFDWPPHYESDEFEREAADSDPIAACEIAPAIHALAVHRQAAPYRIVIVKASPRRAIAAATSGLNHPFTRMCAV